MEPLVQPREGSDMTVQGGRELILKPAFVIAEMGTQFGVRIL